MAVFAWIGLGADGLSSSAYGPAESYLALGQHNPLALYLAIATAVTVFIISFVAFVIVCEHVIPMLFVRFGPEEVLDVATIVPGATSRYGTLFAASRTWREMAVAF